MIISLRVSDHEKNILKFKSEKIKINIVTSSLL